MLRKQDLEERLCCARRICGKETEQNNKKRKRKLVKRNSQRRKRIFKSSFSPLLFLLLTQHHIYIPQKFFQILNKRFHYTQKHKTGKKNIKTRRKAHLFTNSTSDKKKNKYQRAGKKNKQTSPTSRKKNYQSYQPPP